MAKISQLDAGFAASGLADKNLCTLNINPVLGNGFDCAVDPLCPAVLFDAAGNVINNGDDCIQQCNLVGDVCTGCFLFFNDDAQSNPTNAGPVIVCSGRANACFAKDTTTACRVADAAAAPADAYGACWEAANPAIAERVLMAELSAGDVVLTGSRDDGALAFTRVLVNEKRAADVASAVLTLETASGEALSLTADHALFLDGRLAAAGAAQVGATLTTPRGASAITRISARTTSVVNPITLAGTILAADGSRAPLLATTAQMWIAPFMVESPLYSLLVRLSLSSAASYAFPATAQAYYDSYLEPLFSYLTADADAPLQPMPTAALVAMLACFDMAVFVGFVAFALTGFLKSLATAALLVGGARALRKRAASRA